MPLPPTPWIKSYDNPQLYLGGYRSGLEQQQIIQRGQIASAEIANRQAEIAQRGQIAQMELQAKMQQLQQSHLEEQQRLAIMDAYHKTQLGLEEQKLKEASVMNSLKIMDAARKMQAMDRFHSRVSDLMKGNENQPPMDQAKASVVAAMENPEVATGPLAQSARAWQAMQEPELKTKVQDGKTYVLKREGWQPVSEGSKKDIIEERIKTGSASITKQYFQAHAPGTTMSKAQKKEFEKSMLEQKQELNELAKKEGLKLPYPEVEGQDPTDWSKARQIGQFKVLRR